MSFLGFKVYVRAHGLGCVVGTLSGMNNEEIFLTDAVVGKRVTTVYLKLSIKKNAIMSFKKEETVDFTKFTKEELNKMNMFKELRTEELVCRNENVSKNEAEILANETIEEKTKQEVAVNDIIDTYSNKVTAENIEEKVEPESLDENAKTQKAVDEVTNAKSSLEMWAAISKMPTKKQTTDDLSHLFESTKIEKEKKKHRQRDEKKKKDEPRTEKRHKDDDFVGWDIKENKNKESVQIEEKPKVEAKTEEEHTDKKCFVSKAAQEISATKTIEHKKVVDLNECAQESIARMLQGIKQSFKDNKKYRGSYSASAAWGTGNDIEIQSNKYKKDNYTGQNRTQNNNQYFSSQK